MPKNKFQDVIFTIIMATIMVYGMVVYNVALNTGGVSGETFLAALHELPIMVPIAFVLEFSSLGKLQRYWHLLLCARMTDHSLSPTQFRFVSAALCARL